MIRVSFFYPNTQESSFNLDYFMHKHIPVLEEALKPAGLVSVEIERGIGTPIPDVPVPFSIIEHLMFNNFEEMQTAMGEHGQELMADVVNFTNVQPMVQINKIVPMPVEVEA
jgi:uncharacterized protein (TIGR02118 family)